jgi:hypothetical protein
MRMVIRKAATLFFMSFLISMCLSPVAKAQKQKASAAPSQSATTPASSSPTASASNAPMEVEMLSYGGMDEILAKLAHYTCGQAGSNKIVVLDSPALQSLEAFDTFYANAEALKSAFDATALKSGAAAGIDTFADITNAVVAAATASTSENSFSFTIQDPTVAFSLMHHLIAVGCSNVHYGGVYSVNEISSATISRHNINPDNGAITTATAIPLNDVGTELNSLSLERSAALRAVFGGAPGVPCPASKTLASGAYTGNVTVANGTTVGGTTTGGTTTGGTTVNGVTTGGTTTGGTTTGGVLTGGTATGGVPVLAVPGSDPCVAMFNNIDGTYNSFLAGLSAQNPATNQPGISSILQGYPLRALMQTASQSAPIIGVYVNVAAAGGTQQDRKNLITALFTGDWIRYSGGVSINIIVFRSAGSDSSILFSDLLRYRTPLKTISKPKDYKGAGSAGDNLSDIP